ncbi:uncharacterized protein V6R79_018629 [Siganus canaliculatus]
MLIQFGRSVSLLLKLPVGESVKTKAHTLRLLQQQQQGVWIGLIVFPLGKGSWLMSVRPWLKKRLMLKQSCRDFPFPTSHFPYGAMADSYALFLGDIITFLIVFMWQIIVKTC